MMELHRASFVEWQPTPVVSVKATSHFFGGKCVALARENGDLEMYDAHSWRLIGRVPGKDGDSISRLEWVQPFRVDGVSEEDYEEFEEEEVAEYELYKHEECPSEYWDTDSEDESEDEEGPEIKLK